LLFQGPSRQLKIEGKKILDQFFTSSGTVTKEAREWGHEGQKRLGGMPPWLGAPPRLVSPSSIASGLLYTNASVSPKNLTNIFSEIY
jgi:hypothetical protein